MNNSNEKIETPQRGRSWKFRKCRSTDNFNNLHFRSKNKFKRNKNTNKNKKFKWHDGHGRQLTAGGLLPFDDNGIWVIGEIKNSGKYEYTDMGGKYKFEDCDIYTTISREFNEEMYHSQSLSRKDVIQIASENPATYVNNHCNQPIYLCYIVHIQDLKELGIKMEPDKFLSCRERAIKSNPNVPTNYYCSFELKHITYDELNKAVDGKSITQLSYRLKRILRYGPLANKIYDFGNMYTPRYKSVSRSLIKSDTGHRYNLKKPFSNLEITKKSGQLSEWEKEQREFYSNNVEK